MKKTILVMIAGVMILSLAACVSGNVTNDENLQGTWKFESASIDGITADLTVDSSEMIPYDYTFTFLDDGKAIVDVLGVRYSTNYQVTDEIIMFSDATLGAIRLLIDGDNLLMKNEITRTTLTFSKQTEK